MNKNGPRNICHEPFFYPLRFGLRRPTYQILQRSKNRTVILRIAKVPSAVQIDIR